MIVNAITHFVTDNLERKTIVDCVLFHRNQRVVSIADNARVNGKQIQVESVVVPLVQC